jgi:hypothetical protein
MEGGMIGLEIDIDAIAAQRGISDLIGLLDDRTELHQEMAQGVEALVTAHLLALNSRSPNTSFYGRAARSTAVEADGEGATVSVTHRGIALRYFGGRVVPVTPGITNLALPTEHVPVIGGERRQKPSEAGILAFIPNRGGPSVTTGYLVEGEEKTITRGKRKGGKRIVPKPGGNMMFVLRGWTDHAADESVLPTIVEMQAAAARAAEAVIETLNTPT